MAAASTLHVQRLAISLMMLPTTHDVFARVEQAKSDRLSLLRAMRVNVDPIWGLSLASGLTALLDDSAPLCECREPDGVRIGRSQTSPVPAR